VESVDLATADEADFDRLLTAHCGAADHAVAVIVHNAGTLGQVEHLHILYTLWDAFRVKYVLQYIAQMMFMQYKIRILRRSVRKILFFTIHNKLLFYKK